PAEVNQLPDDDGIVFVAGQLPYRVRKVRHFLDPRFRGRDKLPPPAPGTDQARELIELPPSEWAGLRAEPPAKPPQAPSESPVGAIPLDSLAEAVWAAEVLADPERARLRTAAEVAADLDGATAHSSAAGANPLPSSMAAPSASAMAGWKEVLAAARPEASPADGDAGDAGDAQEDLL
ncbi:MAG: hypothetical protein FWD17_18900, partial [Polyangiaceae bacterium]|nr:hypothetical protein [Polyangiaceae bacterium]